jgi:hypothetical protein
VAAPAADAPSPTVVDAAPPGNLAASPLGNVVAYLRADGQLRVRTEDGQVQDVVVPADCAPTAVGHGFVVLQCQGPSLAKAMLVDLAAGSVRDVTPGLPGLSEWFPVAVGSRWVYLQASGEPGAGGHQFTDDVLANLKSGRTISLERDPYGPRRYIDLNSKTPAARLCAGVRRHRQNQPFFEARWQYATLVGPRLFEPSRGSHGTLTSCKTSHVRKLDISQPQAGPRFVAGFDQYNFSTVKLLDLATGSTQQFTPSSTPSTSIIALTAAALWIFNDGDLTEWRLPQS